MPVPQKQKPNVPNKPLVSKGNQPEDRYQTRPQDEFISKGREGEKRLPPHRSKGNS